jgi:hypothetical protein
MIFSVQQMNFNGESTKHKQCGFCGKFIKKSDPHEGLCEKCWWRLHER